MHTLIEGHDTGCQHGKVWLAVKRHIESCIGEHKTLQASWGAD